ncbi:single-stranded DNA-binding protein, partial [Bacteroides uniformis]|uniref:single-stranded DNA-binding protein n=1 Tax=Bacteroides uniformis TaxID=820 RepID=UPI0013956904
RTLLPCPHKGDKVTVFGTISYREYEKDGIKRYITDILAYDIVLGGRSESSSSRPAITESDAPQQSDFPPMQNVGDDDQLPF